MAEKFLIVGLGNPGTRYGGTRHNIGFEAVSHLASQKSCLIETKKFQGLMGEAGDIRFLLPQTFMNDSGMAVGEMARFWKFLPEQIIVVHDDVDLPLGRCRIKQGGGSGGHNGLRSIDKHLPSNNYFRVRLGVDKPVEKDKMLEWVLGKFEKEEMEEKSCMVRMASEIILFLMENGLDKTQNVYHRI